MKCTLIFVLIFFISPIHSLAAKSQKNVTIESAAQFQRWCKHLSYRYFRRKKQQPYNWSASTIRQLNDYQTSGSWKVNNMEKKMFCQIRKGKKAKHTKIEIH
jgi:hypothetical protein